LAIVFRVAVCYASRTDKLMIGFVVATPQARFEKSSLQARFRDRSTKANTRVIATDAVASHSGHFTLSTTSGQTGYGHL
jgi:hypothetical protein